MLDALSEAFSWDFMGTSFPNIATYHRFADGHLQGNPVPCFHVSETCVKKKSSGKLSFFQQPARRWPRSKMRPMFQFHCWTCRSSWIQREGPVGHQFMSVAVDYKDTAKKIRQTLDTEWKQQSQAFPNLLEPNDFVTRSSKQYEIVCTCSGFLTVRLGRCKNRANWCKNSKNRMRMMKNKVPA